MVADAQAHSDEDRKRREAIEARNSADSMAYQVERQVSQLGDRVPMNERARAEQLISQIRELVKANSSDVARLRQLTSDLQQVGYGLSSAASSQDNTGGQRPGGRPDTSGGDDVIAAEFKES